MFLLASLTNDLLWAVEERKWRNLGRRHSVTAYAPSCSWSEFTEDPDWLVHRMNTRSRNWHSQNLSPASTAADDLSQRSEASVSEVLAKRAQNLLANRELAKTYREVYEDLWHPVNNAQGKINLCTAENILCEDLLQERINDPKIWQTLFPTIHHYPPAGGLEWVKSAVAGYVDRFVSMNGDPGVLKENLVIVPGCAAAYDMIGCCLFDANEAVLAPVPFYVRLADNWGERAHVRVIPVAFDNLSEPCLRPKHFQAAFDEASLKGIKVKAISLINPNNPLGHVFPEKDVLDVCKWAVSNDLFIIADEVFASTTQSAHRFRSMLSLRHQLGVKNRKKIIWMWSASKDLCLPGARFAVVHTEIEDLQKGLRRLEILQPCSPIAQHLIGHLLRDHEWIERFHSSKNERLKQNRDFAVGKLDEYKIKYLPADSGLFLFIDFTEYIADETFEAEHKLWKRFTRAGVYLNPGCFMGNLTPGWFRLVISCSQAELEEGLRRLHDILLVVEKRQKDRPKSALPTRAAPDSQSFTRIQSGDDLLNQVFGVPMPLFGALVTSDEHINREADKMESTHIENTPFNIFESTAPQKHGDTAEAFAEDLAAEEKYTEDENYNTYPMIHSHDSTRSNSNYDSVFETRPTTTVQGNLMKDEKPVNQTSFTSSVSPVKERVSLSRQYFMSKGIEEPQLSASQDDQQTLDELYNEFQIPVPKPSPASTVSVQHSKAVSLNGSSDSHPPSISEMLSKITPPASLPEDDSATEEISKPSAESHVDVSEISETSRHDVVTPSTSVITDDEYERIFTPQEALVHHNEVKRSVSSNKRDSDITLDTSVFRRSQETISQQKMEPTMSEESYQRIFTQRVSSEDEPGLPETVKKNARSSHVQYIGERDDSLHEEEPPPILIQKLTEPSESSVPLHNIPGKSSDFDPYEVVVHEQKKSHEMNADLWEQVFRPPTTPVSPTPTRKVYKTADDSNITTDLSAFSRHLHEETARSPGPPTLTDEELSAVFVNAPEKSLALENEEYDDDNKSFYIVTDKHGSGIPVEELSHEDLAEVKFEPSQLNLDVEDNSKDNGLLEKVFTPVPSEPLEKNEKKIQKPADDSKITTDTSVFSRNQQSTAKKTMSQPTLTDEELSAVFVNKPTVDETRTILDADDKENHRTEKEDDTMPEATQSIKEVNVEVNHSANDPFLDKVFSPVPSEPIPVKHNRIQRSVDDSKITTDLSAFSRSRNTESRHALGQPTLTDEELSEVFREGEKEHKDLKNEDLEGAKNVISDHHDQKLRRLVDDSKITTDLSAFSRSRNTEPKHAVGQPTLTDEQLYTVFADQALPKDADAKPKGQDQDVETNNVANELVITTDTKFESSNEENRSDDPLLDKVFSPVPSEPSPVVHKKIQRSVDDSKITTDLSAFSRSRNAESKHALGQPTLTDEELSEVFLEGDRAKKIIASSPEEHEDLKCEDLEEVKNEIPDHHGETTEEKVAQGVVDETFSANLGKEVFENLEKDANEDIRPATEAAELKAVSKFYEDENHDVIIDFEKRPIDLDKVFSPPETNDFNEFHQNAKPKADNTKDSDITLDTSVFRQRMQQTDAKSQLKPTLSQEELREILYPRSVTLDTIKEYSRETDDSNVIHKEDQTSIPEASDDAYLKELLSQPQIVVPKQTVHHKESVSDVHDRQSVSSDELLKSDISDTNEHQHVEEFEDALHRIHKLSDSQLSPLGHDELIDQVFEHQPDPSYFAERHNTTKTSTKLAARSSNPELSDGTNFPRHQTADERRKTMSPTLTDDEYKRIFEEPKVVVAQKSEAQTKDPSKEDSQQITKKSSVEDIRPVEDIEATASQPSTEPLVPSELPEDSVGLPGRRYTESMFDDNVFELSQEDLDKYGKFIDDNTDRVSMDDLSFTQELTDVDEKGESEIDDHKTSPPSVRSLGKPEPLVRESVLSDDVFHAEEEETVRRSEQTTEEEPQNTQPEAVNLDVIVNAHKPLAMKLKEGLSNIFGGKDKRREVAKDEKGEEVSYKRIGSLDRVVSDPRVSSSSGAQSPSAYIDEVFEPTFKNQNSLSDEEELKKASIELVDDAIKNVEHASDSDGGHRRYKVTQITTTANHGDIKVLSTQSQPAKGTENDQNSAAEEKNGDQSLSHDNTFSSPPLSPLHVDTNYQPLSSSTLKRQDYRESTLNDSGIGMDTYHASNAITIDFPLIVTHPIGDEGSTAQTGGNELLRSAESGATLDNRIQDPKPSGSHLNIASAPHSGSVYSENDISEVFEANNTIDSESAERKKQRRYVKRREYRKGEHETLPEAYLHRRAHEYSDSDQHYTDASFGAVSPVPSEPRYHYMPVDFNVTIRSNPSSPRIRPSKSHEAISVRDTPNTSFAESEHPFWPHLQSQSIRFGPTYHLRPSKSSSALDDSNDFASVIEDYNYNIKKKRTLSPEISVTTHNVPYPRQKVHQVHHDVYLERRPGRYYSTERVGSVVVEHTNITEVVHDRSDKMTTRPELLKTKTTTRVESLGPQELLKTLVFDGELEKHKNERADKYVEYRHRRSRAPTSSTTRSSHYVVQQRDTTDSDSEFTDFHRTNSGRFQRGVQTKEALDLCCRMRLIKAVHHGENGPEQAEYVMCRNPSHEGKHDHCNPKRLYAVKRSTIPRANTVRRSPNTTWLVSSVSSTNKYHTIERDRFVSGSETENSSSPRIRSKLYTRATSAK
uniref:Aminotran_1_2 domain-containing protein n=1 Tax=Bursaphelenchus xylophilus TaxID=6326 RepID=A0A1I7RMJ8_BURXY